MKLFHDSRNCAYRVPYGAITVDNPIKLTLDVQDAPGARVTLRTWEDGEGELLYRMDSIDAPSDQGEGVVRYSVTLTPQRVGVIWYHFIIEDANGATMRYGAKPGRRGGEGEMREWEPPSFQLTVHKPQIEQAWYEPIGGYLFDEGADLRAEEVIETLRENTAEELLREPMTWFVADEAVVGFWSDGEESYPTCTLFNTSTKKTHEVLVPLADEEVSELVSGYGIDVLTSSEAQSYLDDKTAAPIPAFGKQDAASDCTAASSALIHLTPLGRVELQFHPHKRLQQPLQPGVGVLAHITSIPGGVLGADLNDPSNPVRSFVEWLAKAGVRYWQILPVNPTDEYGSPYAGISAFAGNVNLLEEGKDIDAQPSNRRAYKAFCKREADWLEPYAAFMAIRGKMGEGIAWQDWPKKYRRYSASLIAADAELAECAEAVKRGQFAFECRWKTLRSFANEHGLQIIGDMPIYVSADSADVWANPELFELDSEGRPTVVAGCPPDAFAVEGQIWGNPVYNWEALHSNGYRWWLRRLERAFSLYDWVRLDHFIGFSRYFSIPAGAKAAEGSYRPGPGFEFFRKAQSKFGQLPLIAEDLGLVTPGVRSLIGACGFEGMDILQFVDGNDPLAYYAPRPDKIVYTGTHDNQTLVGYVIDRYPDQDALKVARELAEKTVTCSAPVCILPLQDVMLLDDGARMNVPGVAEGNWAWQAEASALVDSTDFLRHLVQLHHDAGETGC